MGLEHFSVIIIAFMTGAIATCIGVIFALIGWIRVVFSMKAKRNAHMSLSLWFFSIAVATFPVFEGIFDALPYSMKGHYIFGWEIGLVYLAASSVTSVLLLIISMISAYWDRSSARRVVMIGSIAMLAIYFLSATLFCLASS
jgi:hypothetical protein